MSLEIDHQMYSRTSEGADFTTPQRETIDPGETRGLIHPEKLEISVTPDDNVFTVKLIDPGPFTLFHKRSIFKNEVETVDPQATLELNWTEELTIMVPFDIKSGSIVSMRLQEDLPSSF